MNRDEAAQAAFADLAEATINSAMQDSERSRWSADHKIGVSDIGHCLAGETEIPTRQGIVPISSLAGTTAELLVPAASGSTVGPHAEWREVRVEEFGTQPLMKVTLTSLGRSTREVYATADHEWFITREKRDRNYRTVRTNDLQAGDRMKMARAGNALSAEMIPAAVAMGFVHGDGNKYHSGSEVSIASGGNKVASGVIPLLRGFSRSERATQTGTRYRGFPRSWKEIPDFSQETAAFALSWLAGYFAADGTVDARGGCTIQSSDQRSVAAVRHAATLAGVYVGPPKTRMVKGGYGLEPDQEREVHSIAMRRRTVPDWFFLNHHHRNMVRMSNAKTGRGDSAAWIVKSVEATDRIEPVYCAVVPGEEAFVLTEGLVTHNCREYLRRMLTQQPFSDNEPDSMAAFMGTAFGNLFEAAMSDTQGAVTQKGVTVELDVGDIRLRLPGHADVVFPKTMEHPMADTLIDAKSKNGLQVVSREGPTDQQRFQVTLYAKALIDEGLLTDECTLMVAYFDRSGSTARPEVFAWKYDPAVVEEAQEWLSDVFYAVEHGEEASKDKPRQWCISYCPFATSCRVYDSDVTGLIEDPEALAAIDVYREALDLEKEARKAKESAKAALQGVAGNTENYQVRWTKVEPYTYSVTNKGYEKLSITKRRTGRSKK